MAASILKRHTRQAAHPRCLPQLHRQLGEHLQSTICFSNFWASLGRRSGCEWHSLGPALQTSCGRSSGLCMLWTLPLHAAWCSARRSTLHPLPPALAGMLCLRHLHTWSLGTHHSSLRPWWLLCYGLLLLLASWSWAHGLSRQRAHQGEAHMPFPLHLQEQTPSLLWPWTSPWFWPSLPLLLASLLVFCWSMKCAVEKGSSLAALRCMVWLSPGTVAGQSCQSCSLMPSRVFLLEGGEDRISWDFWVRNFLRI